MRPNRIAVTIAAAMLLAAPASATAGESPLLSGYGGPGAGEQQLIGATLVGGRGSSSGGGGPTSGNGAGQERAAVAPSESSNSAEDAGSNGAENAGSGGGPQQGGGKGQSHRRSGHAGLAPSHKTSGQPSGPSSQPAPRAPLAARNAASQSLALGLSGSQLLMVVLLAFVLLLIATATWRLTRLEWHRDPADTNLMRTPTR
ncbi:MAG TPA: hypothetical protein VGF95_11065 [Solirubrobacteraceae bacterium]|jgi:hypothetical protein